MLSNREPIIQKMSFVNSALAEFHQATNESIVESNTNVTKVYIRLIFIRLSGIDTLNEKFQAQISMESRWLIDLNKILSELSLNDQERLNNGKSISFLKYSEKHWHPHLYIENALSDLKEQIRFTIRKSSFDNQIYVCEHRNIKGLFWQKLQLEYYPNDIQNLSISIGTMFHKEKVLLISDPYRLSRINKEGFIDQQQWNLYEHIDIQQRYAMRFLCHNYQYEHFDTDNDDDDDDKQQKSSILTITCHAARRSNYFYWNGYCLILLITLSAFTAFSILPHHTQNRLQISSTLLLTSITFRWTINRFLPTISYLTTMDKYGIASICVIIGLIVWHAVVGAIVFFNVPDGTIRGRGWILHLDRAILAISLGIYILMQIIFLLWIYYVPNKLRRELQEKDIQYKKLIENKQNQLLNDELKSVYC